MVEVVDSFEAADKVLEEYKVDWDKWCEFYGSNAAYSDWDTALAYCEQLGYPKIVAEALYWNCE